MIGTSVRLSDRSLHRDEQKKNCQRIAPSGVGNQDLQIFRQIPYQLSQVNIQLPACIFMAFIKSCSIDSRNEQCPTCEVVHETNKAHFRNLLPNRFLPSSVGKALTWRSGDPGFNPPWGQFLTKFFFAVLCMRICQIIWQKCLSWKTQISCS